MPKVYDAETKERTRPVHIVDANGNQITSFGSGTQYTEGDVDTTITGTAVMWEDTSDTLRAASIAKPLPVQITDGSNTLSLTSGVSVTPSNPTTTASAYASGDVVGSAITFTNVVPANGGLGRIETLIVRDYMNTPQNAALELWLFDSAPSGIASDNAAWNVSDADLPKVVAVIPTGPYYAGSVNGISVRTGISSVFKCGSSSRDLTGYLVSRGTPTYGADSSSIGVTLVVIPE